MKYNADVKKLFPHGFQLAEPINNKTGGILYPKDTELNTDCVERLLQLKEKNPNYDFRISIKKGKKVANYFRDHIKRDFVKIIESKKNKQEFRKSIGRLEKTFELYIDDILDNDELIYVLFRGRSIDEVTSKSGIPCFFYHSINVTIFALEILQNVFMTTGTRYHKQDLINVAILGLLHDMGSIENLGQISELTTERQKKYYFKGISRSFLSAKDINLESELVSALKKFGDYYQGNKEVVKEDEDIQSKYANILITADTMDLMVSGIFGDPVPIKAATDQLYVLANNKELRRGFVEALAKGLAPGYLFDFYRELERVKKMCRLGDYARPYPMLGFKSPVLVLCGGCRTDCQEYSKSSRAVNLVKPSSGLEPGVYGRCKLLSGELVKFYKSYYADIKENVILHKAKEKQRKNDSRTD
ncbi:hypothetical protein AMJ80_00715 [bacterium SM23_31]|nr:MAG: hypothetical protein AMJ80_00715 [bacterium SM23_31]